MGFKTFNLSEVIQKGIEKLNYEKPTEIQVQSIPVAALGLDIIAQSQTGTGKTAAFAIPILEKIDVNNKSTQSLILCPTRELAVQVARAIREIGSFYEGLKVVPVYGGEQITGQIDKLRRGAQIVVGTPGRVRDHLNRRTLKTDQVVTLVLDEADEMLNMGFKEELDEILSFLPEARQNLFFSATFPREVEALANKYTNNPTRITIERKDVTNIDIDQKYYNVDQKHKLEALVRLIEYQNPKQALIFCNTKRSVDELTDAMIENQVIVEKIHGDIVQNLRLDTIDRFNRGSVKLLIATDVAARGLDITGVDAVYNYDIPRHPESYVHRIGRTGRAGRKGISATLVTKRDKGALKQIFRYIGKDIPKADLPTLTDLNDGRISSFIEEIEEATKNTHKDYHYNIIKTLIAKGYDVKELAYALVSLQVTLDERKDLQLGFNDYDKSGRDNNRNRSRDRDRDRDRSRSSERSSGKPAGRQYSDKDSTLVFNVGKRNKKGVKDIVGLIYSKSKIAKTDIGNIHMTNDQTFVDVDKKNAKVIAKALSGEKMGNATLDILIKTNKSAPSASSKKSEPRKKRAKTEK